MNANSMLSQNLWWIRDARNPILPPGPAGSFDSVCCMNPWVLRIDDTYHLYYAGADDKDHRRICLATAPVGDPADWTRRGPCFDIGEPGSFDANWCVLPHVVQFAPDRWHLYYTGNCGVGEGLSAFPGMGVAISTDGHLWEKYRGNPIIAPTHVPGDPDAEGMAGGSVLKVRLPNGDTEWRWYYTGCPTLGEFPFLDQQKRCCLAVSQDGLNWERRGAILLRDPDHDYENVAVAGPVVHQRADGTFRMWYSAIGTRWWSVYSIGYAESEDGIHWQRGTTYGENLQLGPVNTGWNFSWDSQMTEYPSVIQEGSRLRLFYTGNSYGMGGIGTALSSALRATALPEEHTALRVVSQVTGAHWRLTLPTSVQCNAATLTEQPSPQPRWQGPSGHGVIWREWRVAAGEQAIDCRIVVTHTLDGIDLSLTVMNSDQPLQDLKFPMELAELSACFTDDTAARTTQSADALLRTSRDGAYAIQIAWEGASTFASSDSNLAVAVEIGDLAARETRTLRGCISFTVVAEEAVALL